MVLKKFGYAFEEVAQWWVGDGFFAYYSDGSIEWDVGLVEVLLIFLCRVLDGVGLGVGAEG